MGREQSCSGIEPTHLARAWIYDTEDMISCTDRTASRSNKTIFSRFQNFEGEREREKTFEVGIV